jgi:hypothetical protein
MWNGGLGQRAASLLKRPATWIGAAVVLGAAGSWTVFEPPERQVARSSNRERFGDLREAPLPTLSVEVPQNAPAAGGTAAEPAPSPAARAVFLEVVPADAQGRETEGVQPANWEAPASPAWLTGTIEEVND